ncbi:MAG: altronate dehydratase family protein [Planctomycetaceae bacterium]|nr:altronate dehydratase family protein [Planctomycetaceae bacterium]
MKKLLQIHTDDNVAVAVEDLLEGGLFDGMTVRTAIPRGHKVALREINIGELVIKYGKPIGTASQRIGIGEHVHTHNIISRLKGTEEYEYVCNVQEVVPKENAKFVFQGFRRSNGTVGIRNDLWIIPTVGCVNRLARGLANRINQELPQGSVRQALALEHPLGCSQVGEDHERTARTLAALASHPNAGGVLVLSLGCENNTLESFRQRLDADDPRFRFLKAQDEGSEFETGIALLRELTDNAARIKREEVTGLTIGLKCGGSDALSGITANPLLGAVSDRIIAAGGSSVLTEVPEMFGAETLLLNRCIDRSVFDKGVRMVNNFKEYFLRYGERIDENPSPGNKDGGISTLEDKSIGCVQKGGCSPVVDILEDGKAAKTGLTLRSGPGNDMVACTNLAAAGCQLILFTTGRGTPLGSVVPTLKISSNSELAASKPHWIDFDAGRLLHGTSLAELTDELMQKICAAANGTELALNEQNGYQEIALFKDGVTL